MSRRIRERIFPGDEPEPGAWKTALDRARIPQRYRSAKLGMIRKPDLGRWALEILEHPDRWLGEGYGFVFGGPFRSGKSALAAIFAMDAIQRCEAPLWTTAREIPGIMFREDEEGYDLLHRCDLLVIDDLGAESYRQTGSAGTALEGAIRNVYDRERSLLVTTNLSPRQIHDNYPKSTVSVMERITALKIIDNDQWPRGPEGLV